MTEASRPVAAVSRYVCTGCGAEGPEPFPFRCVNAPGDAPGDNRSDDKNGGSDGGDVDHLLTRVDAPGRRFPDEQDRDPFIRYRGLLHAYQVAMAGGMSDAAYRALVSDLEEKIAAVDGRSFTRTPFRSSRALAARLGLAGEGLWVKNETNNVGGSHKARHLMGLLIELEVRAVLDGKRGGEGGGPTLAIASCGNAALSAALLARAAGRPLEVFIPESADRKVVAQLVALEARLTVCVRQPGVNGDPCFHAFRAAVSSGALPFGCQGSENGLTVDGARTLGYEMVSTLRRSNTALDRLFVQVGGGALGSACYQALREAHALGALPRLPRLYAVQTRGAFPLARAYARVAERIARALETLLGERAPAVAEPSGDFSSLARYIAERADDALITAELRYAATHRSQFMWPWESEPHSLAHGILDDETYDWLMLVEGMLRTGGHPVVVGEETLRQANQLAEDTTGIFVDETGSAGLAGALSLSRSAGFAPDEKVAVIFSGVRR